MTTPPTPSAPATATSLGEPEQAAVLWLATADGFKIARCLSPETLRAVYADLVRAGQYKETVDERREDAGEGVHREGG